MKKRTKYKDFVLVDGYLKYVYKVSFRCILFLNDVPRDHDIKIREMFQVYNVGKKVITVKKLVKKKRCLFYP